MTKAFIRFILSIFIFTLIFQTQVLSQYQLVWSDEFETEGLPDTANWKFQTGGHGWGNNELQYYSNKACNAYVSNGHLVITAKKQKHEKWDYTSARLYTKNTNKIIKYGKIEARIKLPYGQGIWPAFWMLGVNIESAGWPACGEIDIMEMVGGNNRENTAHGTMHWKGTKGHHKYQGDKIKLEQGTFSDDFHVFAIEWTKEEIIWSMDGEVYHRMDITSPEFEAFHKEFYLLLNVAVGGNWPKYPDETTTFPQKMEIDYVRVYQ